MCNAFEVSSSGYYAYKRRGAKIITEGELMLYREVKRLFHQHRCGLGYVKLTHALNQSGIDVGKHRVLSIMRQLKLKSTQRRQYRVNANQYKHGIADNHLAQQFNPEQANQVWCSDITYLHTKQGWVYLAVVIDCYSRKIIGWSMGRRMTKQLVIKALQMAYTLRKPRKPLIHHSDRGSQYVSKAYQRLLKQYGMMSSMSGKGNCYDNAVVERFFGSLKQEWLCNVIHLTRGGMINDVNKYIRYYNSTRLHATLGYVSPNAFEILKLKCAI